jgi:PAS domain S-box-containing protein
MLKSTKSEISKPQSLRVLMVEDSEDDALLIIRELKKGGYDPEHERVETSAAMKKALKDKQWDIILCDYKLPKFDAPSAITVLKETNIDIPIIIVSGAIGEETAAECMRSGANDYIMKGNLSRLCPAITRELEEAEVRNNQRQAEENLQVSEKRLRYIMEKMQDAVWSADLSGQYEFLSPSMASIYGRPLSEMMDNPGFWIEAAHPEDQAAVLVSNDAMRRDGHVELEYRIVLADGTVRWIFDRKSIIRDEHGKPFRIAGIISDITERKQAVVALQLSEIRFRELFNRMSSGVAVYEAIDNGGDFIFSDFNPLAEKIEKVSKKDILGKRVSEVFPGVKAFGIFEIFQRVWRTGNPEYFPENIYKDGRDPGSWRESWVFKLPTGEIVAVYNDITERKQIEEALKESEKKYRLLAGNVNDVIFVLDMNLNYTYISPSVKILRGYEPEELLNKPPTDTLTPSSMELAMRNLSEILELEKSEHREINKTRMLQLEMVRKNGTTVWTEVQFSLIRDENKRAVGIMGVTRDITERKQSFERMRKALGATVQSISTIVEMKDPYTSGHQQQVSDLARSIATEMGLSADQQDFIRTASSIHDIGKISIPTEILSKPTKLTEVEFSLIKTHAQSGHDILKDIDFPWPVADVVLQHHERIDGSGYPHGLKGDDISLEARILAIAEVVEAIASHRPYRPSRGIDFALEEISGNRGILYDADAVDACLKLFREKGYLLFHKE